MFFSTRSKTFLIGEYCVTCAGSAIVLLSSPDFSLSVEQSNSFCVENISNFSPGYEFWNNHIDVFNNKKLIFHDPYNNNGGFGASSAQFVLTYKAYLAIVKQKFNIKCFLDEYKSLECHNGINPSGADCVAQFYNENIYFNSLTLECSKIDFDFKEIDILIFRTDIKISTHQHLKNVNQMNFSHLNVYTRNALMSIQKKDINLLIQSINDFYAQLLKMNLVHSNTAMIVEKLLQLNCVYAAKGCGAFLGDTILLVCDKNSSEFVRKIASTLKLSYCVTIG